MSLHSEVSAVLAGYSHNDEAKEAVKATLEIVEKYLDEIAVNISRRKAKTETTPHPTGDQA